MTAITLSNINKRFGEKVLFRDYSLHIEAGEFVAIKGESGAGKTTLLNIIGLLETPDSGTIDGLKNLKISAVFQEDRLLDFMTPLRRKKPVLFLPRCGSSAAAQAVLPVSELRTGGHRHRGSQHEARHPVR